MLDERLFIPLAVPADNVIAYSPARDRAAETARISSFLAFSGIDIALLSVDSRGHIGFHASGSNLDSTAGIVKVENAQRWEAKEAFSLGLADLARATRILLFAAGRNMAEIVRRLTEGTFDPSVPISVLQRHGNVILVADAGASSRIAREERIHGFYSGFFIVDAQSVPSGRRVLIVSPHPDDAPISVGGTMAMISGANRVVTAVMTTGHRSFIYGTQRDERIAIREAEVVKESRFLGVEPRFLRLPFYDGNYEVTERDLEIFISLLREIDPDWIFTAASQGQPPRPHRQPGGCHGVAAALPRRDSQGRRPVELRRSLGAVQPGGFQFHRHRSTACLRTKAPGNPRTRIAGGAHAVRCRRRVTGPVALGPRSRIGAGRVRRAAPPPRCVD